MSTRKARRPLVLTSCEMERGQGAAAHRCGHCWCPCRSAARLQATAAAMASSSSSSSPSHAMRRRTAEGSGARAGGERSGARLYGWVEGDSGGSASFPGEAGSEAEVAVALIRESGEGRRCLYAEARRRLGEEEDAKQERGEIEGRFSFVFYFLEKKNKIDKT